MPAPSFHVYPSLGVYPGMSTVPSGPPSTDVSGNPTGIDESGYWANLDTSRPLPLRWLSVSLLTGQIICDLPTIVATDPCRRTLGQYESMNVTLYITDEIDPAWLFGTRPMSVALIAYRGAPGSEVIYWGGVCLTRVRPHGSNAVVLTLATPECYLDRRYTGAYTTDPLNIGARVDQNTVVTTLINSFAVANQGLPITVQTVGTGTVPTQYAVYNDYDDKTVYSNLGALNGVLNGPEWTGHWVWNRAANLITPIIYVGNRIGAPVQAGLAPAATFDSSNLLPGSGLTENYASGMGANDITATSSGQGLARPSAMSPHPPSTTLDGRPRVQYRFQPSTSIEDTLTLQGHADRARLLLNDGTNTITLKADASTPPYLGVDWNLGDDLGYVLTGPAHPGDTTGVARCIGYEATDAYTAPSLYVPKII